MVYRALQVEMVGANEWHNDLRAQEQVREQTIVASGSYGCTVRGKRRHDHVGVSTASADALE